MTNVEDWKCSEFDKTKNDDYYVSNSFSEDYKWNAPTVDLHLTAKLDPVAPVAPELKNLESQHNAKWIWFVQKDSESNRFSSIVVQVFQRTKQEMCLYQSKKCR